jgi:hypothetical protein
MRALAAAARRPLQVYLVGGATRRLTIDVDLKFGDDADPVLRAIPAIHFDLYAQALAKIERGHDTDRNDVDALIARGLVDRERLLDYFNDIESELYRFPAVDPPSFRRAVEAVTFLL